jgi:hypothetical protein
MQTRAITGIVVAAGLLALGACSPKDQDPYPDVPTFCNAKAQAECQVATTCAIDVDDCQALRSSLCNMEATAALSGTRKYIQANAPACIAAIDTAYGNGSRDVPYAQLVGPGSISDVCARVFSGNAAINDPCGSPYDCTGGNVCAPALASGIAPDGGAAPRFCAAPVAKSEGDFCGNPGEQCATDTYCALPPTGGGYRCALANEQGQPCDPITAPCVSTQRCEAETGVTDHTCEPRVEANQPCLTSDDCLPSAPYCDPYVGNICTTGLSFATHAPDCDAFKSAAAAVMSSEAGGP